MFLEAGTCSFPMAENTCAGGVVVDASEENGHCLAPGDTRTKEKKYIGPFFYMFPLELQLPVYLGSNHTKALHCFNVFLLEFP